MNNNLLEFQSLLSGMPNELAKILLKHGWHQERNVPIKHFPAGLDGLGDLTHLFLGSLKSRNPLSGCLFVTTPATQSRYTRKQTPPPPSCV